MIKNYLSIHPPPIHPSTYTSIHPLTSLRMMTFSVTYLCTHDDRVQPAHTHCNAKNPNPVINNSNKSNGTSDQCQYQAGYGHVKNDPVPTFSHSCKFQCHGYDGAISYYTSQNYNSHEKGKGGGQAHLRGFFFCVGRIVHPQLYCGKQ